MVDVNLFEILETFHTYSFFSQTFGGRLENFGDAAKMLRVRLFRFCRVDNTKAMNF